MRKVFKVFSILTSFFTYLLITSSTFSYEIILDTSFEEFPTGSLPDGFTIIYDGKGASYQSVVDTIAFTGSKSFRVWGVPYWCANIHYDFNVFDYKKVEVSWKMYATENNSGWIAFINKSGNTWGWGWCGVGFSHKQGTYRIVYTDSNGNTVYEYVGPDKVPIKVNDWNDIKIILDTQTTYCEAYLNGHKLYEATLDINTGWAEFKYYFLDGTTKVYKRLWPNPSAYKGIHGIRLGDCPGENGIAPDEPTYFDDLKIIGYKEINTSPPYLEITSVELYDQDMDRLFEAGEKGKLIVKIANTGKGTAYDMKLKISFPFFNKTIHINKLEPNEEITKEITFTVPIRVKTQKVYAHIELDAGKYSPEPVKIAFSTKAPVPPKFKVAYKIDDDRVGESIGNSNGIIEPRETIELLITVKNIGKGEARDVKVKLISQDVDIIKGEAKIGNLPPGASASGKLVFFVPANLGKDKINFDLKIEEALGIFTTSTKLALNVRKKGGKVYDYAVAYKEEEYSHTPPFVEVEAVEAVVSETSGKCVRPNPSYYFFGVVVYDYDEISDLDYVKNDKELIYNLAQCYLGVPEENIKILENPAYAKLKRELRKFARSIKRKDATLYFYYSGHGILDSEGKFYILPVDASIEDETALKESGINIEELKRLLARAKGKKIAFIDACRIKPNWKPAVVVYKPKLNNMAFIFSTKEGQLSNVDKDKKYSAFTRALYEMARAGLINLDFDEDGYVEISELKKPLIKWTRRVSADPNQTPDFWAPKDMEVFPVE